MVKHLVNIMDIHFLNTTKSNFLRKYLMPHLVNEEKCFVVTANPEIVMKTREDHSYKSAVKSAHYIIPDGIGILLAAKYKKTPLQERIPGIELMVDLLEYANTKGLRCYFLGAQQSVNEKVIQEIKTKFPHVIIAGHHHGFFELDDEEIVEHVVQSAPDIVFVALGLPRQEKWIAQHINRFTKGLFIGVGGSFDVIAGEVERAPDIWIKLNLEWLYRIIKQPSRVLRIFKVFEFIGRVILRRD